MTVLWIIFGSTGWFCPPLPHTGTFSIQCNTDTVLGAGMAEERGSTDGDDGTLRCRCCMQKFSTSKIIRKLSVISILVRLVFHCVPRLSNNRLVKTHIRFYACATLKRLGLVSH